MRKATAGGCGCLSQHLLQYMLHQNGLQRQFVFFGNSRHRFVHVPNRFTLMQTSRLSDQRVALEGINCATCDMVAAVLLGRVVALFDQCLCIK